MNKIQKYKNIKFGFFFLFLFLVTIFSCSKDDDRRPEETEITISVVDLTLNTDAHPADGYILGKVQAETNRGSLTFSIEEQSPSGALFINESTGELSVKDGSLFDFESYPVISAIVKVSNEDVSQKANITINLNAPEASVYHRMINENNIWVNESTRQDGSSDAFTQRKVYFGGEEIINGKNYFRLNNRIINYTFSTRGWYRHDNSVGEEMLLYKIREDEEAKKVYALDGSNNEVLLYDFSLSQNDVIDLWDYTTSNYITQTVTEVADITLLNGETRKKITFESGYSIIESIGYDDVRVRGAASLIGFFSDNTLLLKDQYHEFGEDFWVEGKLPEVSLEDFRIINKELISRSDLISDGGNYVENNILEKGICWSTSPNPTVEDFFTSEYKNEYTVSNEVSNLRKFYTTVSTSGFQPNTVYYFRSYSKNQNGITYSDTTHSIDSGFLSSTLFTTLISKEFFEGTYLIHLKGGISENNFPNSATVVEKGFAKVIINDNDKPVHGPFQSTFYPIEDGTLDNFEIHTHLSIPYPFGSRVGLFWSYVKFDNGAVVYGKQLTIVAN